MRERRPRSTQTHGRNSKVYVPIIRTIFLERYTEGATAIDFTLEDIREVSDRLGMRERTRNAGDVVYRMRSRTRLPEEILARGFTILRQTGRGRYRLELGDSTIVELDPAPPIVQTNDLTPLPVRRLLPEHIADVDEQGLLTIVNYCKLLDHFTGLQVFRLRNHVRKSVEGVGQAEVDEVDVGVALRDDEMPVVFPIEAKAVADSINRVQVAAQVKFALQYFPGLEVRPIAIKVDDEGLIHMIEFTADPEPANLRIVQRATYKLNLSERQRVLIRSSIQVRA